MNIPPSDPKPATDLHLEGLRGVAALLCALGRLLESPNWAGGAGLTGPAVAALSLHGASWLEAAPKTKTPPATSTARAAHWREFLRQQEARAVLPRLLSRFATESADFDFSAGTRPMPSMDEYRRIIAQSGVSLGINRYPEFRHPASQPGTYSRWRDIEAPMLGACCLTKWTEGLDEHHDPATKSPFTAPGRN